MTRNITIYSYIKHYESPRYQHDCAGCRFVGCLEEFDVYTCGDDNVLLRYGDEPSQYGSYNLSAMTPPYWKIVVVGSDEATWNIKTLVLLRELQRVGAIQISIKMI